MALLCLVYAARVRGLASSAQPIPGWRQGCFYAGGLVFAAALIGGGKAGEELLFVHMIESLLIADVAALLIVLGLTAPLLAPILEIPLFDRLRVLAHPLVALPLWALDLYLWHLPGLYQGALEHVGLNLLQHVMFLGFGINLWMCLFGPLPMPGWFGSLGKLLYIVAVSLAAAALGNIFLWSDAVFYPFYLGGDSRHHLSPLADQNLAGAVMMAVVSLFTVGLFCWLFRRSAREASERQELLDFARVHGLSLSDQRAARAVSAGRGAELRQRLESRVELGDAPPARTMMRDSMI
ncbi:MAG: cytochrome c oxidase assembly protein [Solirubrobacteraceae bacterium]